MYTHGDMVFNLQSTLLYIYIYIRNILESSVRYTIRCNLSRCSSSPVNLLLGPGGKNWGKGDYGDWGKGDYGDWGNDWGNDYGDWGNNYGDWGKGGPDFGGCGGCGGCGCGDFGYGPETSAPGPVSSGPYGKGKAPPPMPVIRPPGKSFSRHSGNPNTVPWHLW